METNLKRLDNTAKPSATLDELLECLDDIRRTVNAWAIMYRHTVDSDGLPDEFGVTCSVLNAQTLARQLYLTGLRERLEASERVFDE